MRSRRNLKMESPDGGNKARKNSISLERKQNDSLSPKRTAKKFPLSPRVTRF